MPNLLRYRELAVVHYSGIPCALHLRHARQSLNLGFCKKHIMRNDTTAEHGMQAAEAAQGIL